MNKPNYKKISFSAISVAITVVALYLLCILPTGKLALLALGVCFSWMVFSECGVRHGIIYHIATSLIALLLIPKTAYVLAYVLFLGYYPLIKLKIKSLPLRTLIFAAVFALCFLIFKNILLPGVALLFYHYVLGILFALVVFIIFDYAISIFDIFYKNRLGFLRKNF